MTRCLSIVLSCLMFGAAAAAADLESVRTFDIKPQRLETALIEFSRQADLQVIGATDTLADTKTGGITGKLSSREALKALLKDTRLAFNAVGAHSVQIVQPKPQPAPTSQTMTDVSMIHLARAEVPQTARQTGSEDEQEAPEDTRGVPEILVKGNRSLNLDIERTKDDVQPYVVFERQEIERSQSVNLEDFLRARLPMNAASGSKGQATSNSNPASGVNLRGLGENQTLILVDGRRMPGVASLGAFEQPNLNGIPLAAVERIEVLPSTAGGIYGGSATGGVINIVLRRDFSGAEAKVNYANTFDSDTGALRLDVSGGFSLEGGHTQVTVAASHSRANDLTVADRDFADRAIALQLENNPSAITASSTPPLGATVNIRSVSGLLTLDPIYGSTALGSNMTHIPLGYAGPASDNGAGLVANAGRYNLGMPGGMAGTDRGLLVAPSTTSFALNLRRTFAGRFDGFLDFSRFESEGASQSANVPNLVTNLPADAPNNPFQQAINVRFPAPHLAFESRSESLTTRATAGLIVRLPHDWTGGADYAWSRSRSYSWSAGSIIDSAGTLVLGTGRPAPDGRPALDALQEGNTFPLDFTPYRLPATGLRSGPSETVMDDATVRLSGPALDLPGGALQLSALAEWRSEELQGAFMQLTDVTTGAPVLSFYPPRSQKVISYAVETRAPLIGRDNALPFARELELQASVRRDEYETRNDGRGGVSVPSRDGPFPPPEFTTQRLGSTDYTVGLRFAPRENIALRASFGTGFLPPSTSQIVASSTPSTGAAGMDRKRGDTSVYTGFPYALVFGGSPDLEPEESRSYSAGLIFTPASVPGLRLSLDYTRIEKTGEIRAPGVQFILDNEDILPGRVVRGDRLAGDDPEWAGRIVSLDVSSLNLARTSVKTWDIQADYTFITDHAGEFRWYAVATHALDYDSRTLPAAPFIDSAGFSGGPLKWRGNVGCDWSRGPLMLSWNTQYYGAYFIYTATASNAAVVAAVLNQGAATVPDQIYHDFNVTYRFGGAAGTFSAHWLANSEISFGIRNVFDQSPPILAATSLFAPGYSTYGDPLLRRYSLSVRKSFN